MKKMITILLVLLLALSLAACGSSADTDTRINAPKSASDLEGEDYQDVMTLLQVAGFTNIEVEVLDDLITGWITKDGEVEKVSINGVTSFSANSKFPFDSKIVITYHTFPSQETEQVAETSTNPETIESTETSATPDTTEFTEATETKDTTEFTEETEANEVYSISDSEDLQELIKLDNEKDESSIISTVSKYEGKKIELQLLTAFVEPYEDYDTRFNYLLYAVDGEKVMLSGPAFMFENVNFSDLHMIGSNIPETFDIGILCNVTAEVDGYEDGMILLIPVSIEVIEQY